MLPRGHGAVLFTGASASVKGYPQSAPFAMGKFALRGLAQSMARELAPQGIHVAHFIIDGAIRNPGRTEPPDKPQSMLDPDVIALNYLHILRQPRSAWTWELDSGLGSRDFEADRRFPAAEKDISYDICYTTIETAKRISTATVTTVF